MMLVVGMRTSACSLEINIQQHLKIYEGDLHWLQNYILRKKRADLTRKESASQKMCLWLIISLMDYMLNALPWFAICFFL